MTRMPRDKRMLSIASDLPACLWVEIVGPITASQALRLYSGNKFFESIVSFQIAFPGRE